MRERGRGEVLVLSFVWSGGCIVWVFRSCGIDLNFLAVVVVEVVDGGDRGVVDES